MSDEKSKTGTQADTSQSVTEEPRLREKVVTDHQQAAQENEQRFTEFKYDITSILAEQNTLILELTSELKKLQTIKSDVSSAMQNEIAAYEKRLTQLKALNETIKNQFSDYAINVRRARSNVNGQPFLTENEAEYEKNLLKEYQQKWAIAAAEMQSHHGNIYQKATVDAEQQKSAATSNTHTQSAAEQSAAKTQVTPTIADGTVAAPSGGTAQPTDSEYAYKQKAKVDLLKKIKDVIVAYEAGEHRKNPFASILMKAGVGIQSTESKEAIAELKEILEHHLEGKWPNKSEIKDREITRKVVTNDDELNRAANAISKVSKTSALGKCLDTFGLRSQIEEYATNKDQSSADINTSHHS